MKTRLFRPPGNRAQFAVAVALLASGCWRVPDADREIITPWLLCADCTSGELQHVVSHGRPMIRYLKAALFDGPTRADNAKASAQATEAVLRATRYRAGKGLPGPMATAESLAIVSRQEDYFKLTYRLRAAQALERIDSIDAKRSVLRFCLDSVPEYRKHPEFNAAFKRIGSCP
jgi:hypothetical protein